MKYVRTLTERVSRANLSAKIAANAADATRLCRKTTGGTGVRAVANHNRRPRRPSHRFPTEPTAANAAIVAVAVCVSLCLPGPVSTQAQTSTKAESSGVAFVDDQTVTIEDLGGALVEAAGAEVLVEYVIDRELGERLKRKGVTITREQVAYERDIILGSLAADENESALLLKELKRRRGLGPIRYEALLRRNAGLRALIAEDVTVTEGMIARSFQLRYGPRYESRLILVRTLGEAQEAIGAIQKLGGPTAFAEVASSRSLDPSAGVGGRLPAISAVDPEYPDAVRDALVVMEPGQISPPIVVESGFAILKLERKIPARKVQLADVKDRIEREVRLRVQKLAMENLGRDLLLSAEVIPLTQTLKEQWERNLPRRP